jgi:hypothetical protein
MGMVGGWNGDAGREREKERNWERGNFGEMPST